MEARKLARNVLGRGLGSLISSSAPVPIERPSPEKKDNKFNELSNLGHPKTPLAVAPAGKVETAQISQPTPPQSTSRLQSTGVAYLSIDRIVANPFQPRSEFKEVELRELADSIRALGLIQPILVRPGREEGCYELVAGERRLRAAQLAGLKEIPSNVKSISDKESLEVALVENIQREDLNPIEQAKAYQRLSEEFSLNQQEIAEQVGKDRATVANFMRLLKLPPEVIALIQDGTLSMGHAKAILTIRESKAQVSLAKKAAKEGLSVRALETLVSKVVVLDSGRKAAGSAPIRAGTPEAALGNFSEVTDRLRNSLGTKVTIKHRKSGKGKIEIEYFSEQELERIIEHICR